MNLGEITLPGYIKRGSNNLGTREDGGWETLTAYFLRSTSIKYFFEAGLESDSIGKLSDHRQRKSAIL